MLISAFAAIVLFAAPETAQGGSAETQPAAAEAKPAMHKVCVRAPLSGSNLPKKKCRMEPDKNPRTAEQASEKATKAE